MANNIDKVTQQSSKCKLSSMPKTLRKFLIDLSTEDEDLIWRYLDEYRHAIDDMVEVILDHPTNVGEL